MPFIFKSLEEFAKSVAFKHTGLGAPTYPYNVEPIQLSTLVMEIERLRDKTGNIVEIGVARGLTTRFLAEHLLRQRLHTETAIFAIDTFESFVKEDLEYEVQSRGKSLHELKGFAYNDYDKWASNLKDFPFVKPIKTDCSAFDYTSISPIKLTFLDVDLYLPTKKTLPKLWEATVVGGAILVDDVLNNTTYDGAYQSYMEFCAEMKLEPKVIGNKCGILIKE